MIKFLQINLHRSATAQQLLRATMATNDIDVALISEQPRMPPENPRSLTCRDNNCGILLSKKANFLAERRGEGPGFVWTQHASLRMYSCYLPPGRTLDESQRLLNGLEQSIRSSPTNTNILVGGDFNAKSHEWGSNTEDTRGVLLAEMMAGLGFHIANSGNHPTYQRVNAESIIDHTFFRSIHPLKVSVGESWTSTPAATTTTSHFPRAQSAQTRWKGSHFRRKT